jgi:hypothetical protein
VITSGSDAPANGKRPNRRRLGIGCLIIGAVLVGLPLVFTALLDRQGSNGPELQAVGFGTGGSGCDLANVGSSFAVGVAIRDVLTVEPALQPGAVVTITTERNGTELVDLHETITIEEPAPCIYGTMPSLDPGHYRVVYDVQPRSMPAISGEFDVTP